MFLIFLVWFNLREQTLEIMTDYLSLIHLRLNELKPVQHDALGNDQLLLDV